MDPRKLFEKAEKLRSKEKLEESIESYKQVILTNSNDWLAAESAHMIGVIYYQQKNYPEALKWLRVSQSQFKLIKDSDLIGAVLRDISSIYFDKNDLKHAEEYIIKSIKYLKFGHNLGHLGISQVKLGLIKKDEQSILDGIKNIEQSPDRFFESIAYYNLAQVQKDLGKLNEANKSALKSLQILNLISKRGEFLDKKKKLKEFLDGLS